MAVAPASDFAKDLTTGNALIMSGKYPDQATIAQRGPIPVNFLDPYAQGAIDALQKRVPKFYKDTHEFDGLILQDIYLPSDMPDELNQPPTPPTPPTKRFLITEDQVGTYEPYYFNQDQSQKDLYTNLPFEPLEQDLGYMNVPMHTTVQAGEAHAKVENFYLHNAHSTKYYQTMNTTWDDIFTHGEQRPLMLIKSSWLGS